MSIYDFSFPGSSGLAGPRELRIVDSSADPLTLNPHRSFDPDSDVVISQIYEGLIDYNTRGQLIPRLAVKWKQLSPTRFRFWLRRGVRFHNGEPLHARAVQYSLERQLHRRPKSANSWLFHPDLHGEIVGPDVVDLVTGRPDARLPFTLPTFFKIVPPKYTKRYGDKGLSAHPVGTGPYRFVSWDKGQRIRLTRNPNYWRDGFPRIQDVSFLFITPRRQVEALLTGQVDLLTKLPGKDTLTVMAARRTRVLKRHVASVFWAAMKNFDSPFADRRVRRAMNYAVNKRHLIEYVDKGNSIQVSTMTNPLERDYNPNLRPYPFDPAKARRLLAEAGHKRRIKVRVLASDDTQYMIKAIKAQLRMVGVDLSITVVPRLEYLRQTVLPKLKYGRPKFDGDMVVWLTPNPTLDAFFSPAVIFYSGSPYSIMRDPAFDRLYRSFVFEADHHQRRRKLFRLQAQVLQEAYGIYTAQRVQTFGLDRHLKIQLHPSGMLFGFTLAEAHWDDLSRRIFGTGRSTAGPGSEGRAQ